MELKTVKAVLNKQAVKGGMSLQEYFNWRASCDEWNSDILHREEIEAEINETSAKSKDAQKCLDYLFKKKPTALKFAIYQRYKTLQEKEVHYNEIIDEEYEENALDKPGKDPYMKSINDFYCPKTPIDSSNISEGIERISNLRNSEDNRKNEIKRYKTIDSLNGDNTAIRPSNDERGFNSKGNDKTLDESRLEKQNGRANSNQSAFGNLDDENNRKSTSTCVMNKAKTHDAKLKSSCKNNEEDIKMSKGYIQLHNSSRQKAHINNDQVEKKISNISKNTLSNNEIKENQLENCSPIEKKKDKIDESKHRLISSIESMGNPNNPSSLSKTSSNIANSNKKLSSQQQHIKPLLRNHSNKQLNNGNGIKPRTQPQLRRNQSEPRDSKVYHNQTEIDNSNQCKVIYNDNSLSKAKAKENKNEDLRDVYSNHLQSQRLYNRNSSKTDLDENDSTPNKVNKNKEIIDKDTNDLKDIEPNKRVIHLKGNNLINSSNRYDQVEEEEKSASKLKSSNENIKEMKNNTNGNIDKKQLDNLRIEEPKTDMTVSNDQLNNRESITSDILQPQLHKGTIQNELSKQEAIRDPTASHHKDMIDDRNVETNTMNQPYDDNDNKLTKLSSSAKRLYQQRNVNTSHENNNKNSPMFIPEINDGNCILKSPIKAYDKLNKDTAQKLLMHKEKSCQNLIKANTDLNSNPLINNSTNKSIEISIDESNNKDSSHLVQIKPIQKTQCCNKETNLLKESIEASNLISTSNNNPNRHSSDYEYANVNINANAKVSQKTINTITQDQLKQTEVNVTKEQKNANTIQSIPIDKDSSNLTQGNEIQEPLHNKDSNLLEESFQVSNPISNKNSYHNSMANVNENTKANEKNINDNTKEQLKQTDLNVTREQKNANRIEKDRNENPNKKPSVKGDSLLNDYIHQKKFRNIKSDPNQDSLILSNQLETLGLSNQLLHKERDNIAQDQSISDKEKFCEKTPEKSSEKKTEAIQKQQLNEKGSISQANKDSKQNILRDNRKLNSISQEDLSKINDKDFDELNQSNDNQRMLLNQNDALNKINAAKILKSLQKSQINETKKSTLTYLLDKQSKANEEQDDILLKHNLAQNQLEMKESNEKETEKKESNKAFPQTEQLNGNNDVKEKHKLNARKQNQLTETNTNLLKQKTLSNPQSTMINEDSQKQPVDPVLIKKSISSKQQIRRNFASKLNEQVMLSSNEKNDPKQLSNNPSEEDHKLQQQNDKKPSLKSISIPIHNETGNHLSSAKNINQHCKTPHNNLKQSNRHLPNIKKLKEKSQNDNDINSIPQQPHDVSLNKEKETQNNNKTEKTINPNQKESAIRNLGSKTKPQIKYSSLNDIKLHHELNSSGFNGIAQVVEIKRGYNHSNNNSNKDMQFGMKEVTTKSSKQLFSQALKSRNALNNNKTDSDLLSKIEFKRDSMHSIKQGNDYKKLEPQLETQHRLSSPSLNKTESDLKFCSWEKQLQANEITINRDNASYRSLKSIHSSISPKNNFEDKSLAIDRFVKYSKPVLKGASSVYINSNPSYDFNSRNKGKREQYDTYSQGSLYSRTYSTYNCDANKDYFFHLYKTYAYYNHYVQVIKDKIHKISNMPLDSYLMLYQYPEQRNSLYNKTESRTDIFNAKRLIQPSRTFALSSQLLTNSNLDDVILSEHYDIRSAKERDLYLEHLKRQLEVVTKKKEDCKRLCNDNTLFDETKERIYNMIQRSKSGGMNRNGCNTLNKETTKGVITQQIDEESNNEIQPTLLHYNSPANVGLLKCSKPIHENQLSMKEIKSYMNTDSLPEKEAKEPNQSKKIFKAKIPPNQLTHNKPNPIINQQLSSSNMSSELSENNSIHLANQRNKSNKGIAKQGLPKSILKSQSQSLKQVQYGLNQISNSDYENDNRLPSITKQNNNNRNSNNPHAQKSNKGLIEPQAIPSIDPLIGQKAYYTKRTSFKEVPDLQLTEERYRYSKENSKSIKNEKAMNYYGNAFEKFYNNE